VSVRNWPDKCNDLKWWNTWLRENGSGWRDVTPLPHTLSVWLMAIFYRTVFKWTEAEIWEEMKSSILNCLNDVRESGWSVGLEKTRNEEAKFLQWNLLLETVSFLWNEALEMSSVASNLLFCWHSSVSWKLFMQKVKKYSTSIFYSQFENGEKACGNEGVKYFYSGRRNDSIQYIIV